MEERILKTIMWSDAKGVVVSLASKNLGRAQNDKPADFNEFIVSYPAVSRQRMSDFLNRIVLRNALKDVTNQSTHAEDSCLLDASTATSVEIMLRHLQTLNTGGKIKSLWAFLDTEKKAVVHFVNKKGWYAEAYFSSPDEFSVLHLLEAPDGQKSFIPVTFTQDLSKLMSKVGRLGGFCLHDYFPRVKCDFLSKKGRKNKTSDKPAKSGGGRHDKWDGL